MNAGVPVTLLHYPGGNASGQRLNTMSVIVTNYSEVSPVGDKVTFSVECLVTGANVPSTI
jgi:hypothetical protein